MAPFDVGKFVEVTPDYEQMRDTYYLAEVLREASQRQYFIRYENVFDKDGEKRIQRVNRTKMRPVPPLVITSCAVGDEVNVPLLNGWWKAEVVSVNEPMVRTKLAHFDLTFDFPIEDIRMHMIWNRRTPSIWSLMKHED